MAKTLTPPQTVESFIEQAPSYEVVKKEQAKLAELRGKLTEIEAEELEIRHQWSDQRVVHSSEDASIDAFIEKGELPTARDAIEARFTTQLADIRRRRDFLEKAISRQEQRMRITQATCGKEALEAGLSEHLRDTRRQLLSDWLKCLKSFADLSTLQNDCASLKVPVLYTAMPLRLGADVLDHRTGMLLAFVTEQVEARVISDDEKSDILAGHPFNA